MRGGGGGRGRGDYKHGERITGMSDKTDTGINIQLPWPHADPRKLIILCINRSV